LSGWKDGTKHVFCAVCPVLVAYFVHIEGEMGRNTIGYLDGLLKECQDCFD
jgi:hypothetical protein